MARTRRQAHRKNVDRLEAELAGVRAVIEALTARVDGGERASAELTDAFNEAYDREYELEREIRSAESDWGRRNWTFSDYASWNLVAANID
jgi:chromosome segregation ATPase